MRQARISFQINCLFFLFVFWRASAGEETASQIMEKMDSRLRGKTNRAVVEMTIVTPKWTRQLTVVSWAAGRERSLVKIIEPAKERGVSSLRLGSNMWNYLPTVERTIKIPPSMMMQPWMGSDFSNDDMVKTYSYVTDYQPTLLQTILIGQKPAWVIKCEPKPGIVSLWKQVIFTITKDYFPARQEFFADSQQPVKRLDFSEVKSFGDRDFPSVWTMTNLLKPGRHTRLVYRELEFDIQIPESVFTLTNLARPTP
ncbi:MAG: outer membrane lipoprotein-sorting protein [Candidatus Omnitrophica bacterium]|nr:outer membrane lipoprotein-sorting protein [Candidatus Omnitrophota bacterium]